MGITEKYYNDYWKKRLETVDNKLYPIRSFIPEVLVKYSQYGACLNLVPSGSKLLDIGCGEGNVTEIYKIRKGCDVYGLEISDIAIERAKKRDVNVTKWNLNEYPYPYNGSNFDAITVVDVLEHVINPLYLLKEARRILKNNGRIIILVPNFARVKNRFRMLLMGDPLDILHWGGYGDGMEHLHWFTKPKLEQFLKESGFRNVRFYPIGLPFGFVYGLFYRFNFARLLIATGEK